LTSWEAKLALSRYDLYHPALEDSTNKVRKYYNKLDLKPSYILALGEPFLCARHLKLTFSVAHPYYKLGYIEIAWGGEAEQTAEIAAGNPTAKNWVDEARQVVEKMVRYHSLLVITLTK
jgi:hypothetical protein